MSPSELKTEILRLTREYSRLAHAANRPGQDPARATFLPGQTIPYAGRVFCEDEVEAAVSSTLDFWLTLGPEGEAMEKELAAFMGVKHSLLVNSGSSANLVAISALTTHKLPDHKRIKPGDEVITVAAGFPTTVAPIIQVGAIPVFLDVIPHTGNADCRQLEAAYKPGKTKAVMMAHALGNPFDLAIVLEFCHKYDLWLVEDNCDALGCTYSLPLDLAKSLGLDHLIKLAEKNRGGELNESMGEGLEESDVGNVVSSSISRSHVPLARLSARIPCINDGILTAYTGSFGDISTQSFYPPHHLTMGEGGAVNIIRRPALKTYAESFRDWGRDCWCPSGKDNTCNKRFQWQLGELPEGYDHKYIYSHLGFNLKPLDPQAAIGRVQIRRLPEFIEARKHNWERLRQGLADLERYIVFALPTHATGWVSPAGLKGADTDCAITPPVSPQEFTHSPLQGTNTSNFTWDDTGCRTECSWFGFKMTVQEDAPFTRTELARELDDHKIGNRMLFGGNLVRQPAFVQLRRDRPDMLVVITPDGRRLEGAVLERELAATNENKSPLPGADRIMNHTIFLGTYPGLCVLQIDHMVKVIRDFVLRKAADV